MKGKLKMGYRKFSSVSIADVRITDPFWRKYIDVITESSIPYLWNALNDNVPGAAASHAIDNYKIAAGLCEGDYYGPVFQDSDVSKWVEGAALSLFHDRDERLEALVDYTVDVISAAQQPDGYLNSYYTIKEPGRRWTTLREGHELYCAGHLMEAAVAYFKATGKRKLLDTACRYADLICRTFGEGPDKIKGYAGHPEIELALVKLYETTGKTQYLETAKYFIDQRGQEPNYFDMETSRYKGEYFNPNLLDFGLQYGQAHRPVREQSEAVGHAVRAMYLYTGMADIAMRYDDEELLKALKRIWQSVTKEKMYITGAIGSTEFGESFSGPYDLPNDRAYAETCASIGLMMFANRMLEMELDAQYADVMELALYNVVLGSMALDGKAFFYVNPLEVYPEKCVRRDCQHVLPERQKWFSCSCCPPNAIRTVLSVGNYAYSVSEDAFNIHLFIGADASVKIKGKQVEMHAESGYPLDGHVRYMVKLDSPIDFSINIRIPQWSKNTKISVNGEPCEVEKAQKGYLAIKRCFRNGDVIDAELDMNTAVYRASEKVRENAGKVAVRRGPFVYCAESTDNGENLYLVRIDARAQMKAEYDAALLNGITKICAKGSRMKYNDNKGGMLYYTDHEIVETPLDIVLIPYYAWANRGSNEMRVWIEEKNR